MRMTRLAATAVTVAVTVAGVLASRSSAAYGAVHVTAPSLGGSITYPSVDRTSNVSAVWSLTAHAAA
jgi:hypothetical protein